MERMTEEQILEIVYEIEAEARRNEEIETEAEEWRWLLDRKYMPEEE